MMISNHFFIQYVLWDLEFHYNFWFYKIEGKCIFKLLLSLIPKWYKTIGRIGSNLIFIIIYNNNNFIIIYYVMTLLFILILLSYEFIYIIIVYFIFNIYSITIIIFINIVFIIIFITILYSIIIIDYINIINYFYTSKYII